MRERYLPDPLVWDEDMPFERMCEMTVKWISRDGVKSTPGYLSEPDPETDLIMNDLILLNQNGYLTSNSQPGRRGLGWKQRAWVTGYCDRDRFEKIANIRSERFVVIGHTTDKSGMPSAKPIYVTKKFGRGVSGVVPEWYPYGIGEFKATHSKINFHAVDLKWGLHGELWEALCAQF